jgi:hypothetical protein
MEFKSRSVYNCKISQAIVNYIKVTLSFKHYFVSKFVNFAISCRRKVQKRIEGQIAHGIYRKTYSSTSIKL